MTNKEIRVRLEQLSTTKYKKFSEKLIPGSRTILGVNIPEQRKLAKELAKGDWKSYLDNALDNSFEEVNIQGFVIGYVKAEYNEVLPYIKKYVSKINDWSLCDGFCATLKIIKKHKEEFKSVLKEYALKNSEFEQRFVAVMLMDYYLSDEDIEETLIILDGLKNEGYYCKMGVAWAIATAMAKQREKTMKYMLNNTLDDFTYNKAIQKMIESYRINESDKVFLRSIKR